MGGHGHGHHDPYKVPDYKIYKLENCPELLAAEKALASHGLKDPWLRNEAWRFDTKVWGTPATRMKATFLRGTGVGLVAALITTIGTIIYDKAFPSDHGHGHGGDHH